MFTFVLLFALAFALPQYKRADETVTCDDTFKTGKEYLSVTSDGTTLYIKMGECVKYDGTNVAKFEACKDGFVTLIVCDENGPTDEKDNVSLTEGDLKDIGMAYVTTALPAYTLQIHITETGMFSLYNGECNEDDPEDTTGGNGEDTDATTKRAGNESNKRYSLMTHDGTKITISYYSDATCDTPVTVNQTETIQCGSAKEGLNMTCSTTVPSAPVCNPTCTGGKKCVAKNICQCPEDTPFYHVDRKVCIEEDECETDKGLAKDDTAKTCKCPTNKPDYIRGTGHCTLCSEDSYIYNTEDQACKQCESNTVFLKDAKKCIAEADCKADNGMDLEGICQCESETPVYFADGNRCVAATDCKTENGMEKDGNICKCGAATPLYHYDGKVCVAESDCTDASNQIKNAELKNCMCKDGYDQYAPEKKMCFSGVNGLFVLLALVIFFIF